MGRKIVVSSNCQTGGLTAAIAAMLPADTAVPCPWVGDDASEHVLREELRDADAWVTAAERGMGDEFLPNGRSVTVVRVPRILFGAFHPDTIYVAGPGGEWLESPVARLHSAIVVWGWRNGLGAEQITDLFTTATMQGLGYTSDWNAATERLRSAVEATDIDFPSFFLPLRQGLPFMLSVNHPRISVLIHLARQVARLLGAETDLVEFPWEGAISDRLLASGPLWPVYPPIAESLGLRGGYVWRRFGGGFLCREQFIAESLARYAELDPAAVIVPALDDPRFDAVLGHPAAT
jgi:hypothetical protein